MSIFIKFKGGWTLKLQQFFLINYIRKINNYVGKYKQANFVLNEQNEQKYDCNLDKV